MRPSTLTDAHRRMELGARTARLLGHPPPTDGSTPVFERWLAAAMPAADRALRNAAAAPEEWPLTELLRLWADLSDAATTRKQSVLQGIQAALAQLRTTSDLETTYDRGVRMLCDVCGFDRALLWRLEGSRLRIVRILFPGQTELEQAFREVAEADPPRLTHMLLETEMVRRRSPVLVRDAANDPRTHKALIAAGLSSSYVAAPILPAGKVVGFLHADRFGSGREVDETDRDALFAYAEGFGYAIERTVLLERLRAQSHEVRRLMRATEATVAGLAQAELDLAPDLLSAVLPEPGTPQSRAEPPTRLGVPLEDLLTRREREVLRLMADGRTNAAIADELVISPTTVKSHVQSVLRKMQAGNRAEAVSRYLRLATLEGG